MTAPVVPICWSADASGRFHVGFSTSAMTPGGALSMARGGLRATCGPDVVVQPNAIKLAIVVEKAAAGDGEYLGWGKLDSMHAYRARIESSLAVGQGPKGRWVTWATSGNTDGGPAGPVWWGPSREEALAALQATLAGPEWAVPGIELLEPSDGPLVRQYEYRSHAFEAQELAKRQAMINDEIDYRLRMGGRRF